MTSVQLVRVAERHKPVLANLVQFYRYDFTEIRDIELTSHGTYPYRHLDHYFVETSREATFIVAEGRLAGFALMRRQEDGTNQVADFFVLRAHRGKGVGRAAARALFERFPGRWSLEFDHANDAGARFWRGVVGDLAAGPVESRDLLPPDVDYPCTQLRFEVTTAR